MKKSAHFFLAACGKRHEHTFDGGWQANDTQHWKAVTCEHSDAITYEAHVPDGGRLVEDNFVYTCTVCGREYTDAEQTARLEKGTRALLETANAYLNKKGLLEYDQYNGRRQTLSAPEEATEQSYLYLDCSSYVASVYYNTFGIRVMPESYGSQNTKNYSNFAKEYFGKDPTVVLYCETLDYATAEAQDAYLSEVRALLRPGDILVYRRGEKGMGKNYDNASLSGHAMLYMGDGRFTHSTGTSYNNGSSEKNLIYKDEPTLGADRATRDEYNYGTVQGADANDVVARGSGSKMLFRENSSQFVYNFSILRPMMCEGGIPEITEQAECRLALPSVSLEKTVDVGLNSAVCVGESITYKIKAWNNGRNIYEAIPIIETLPEGVSFVESSIPMEQDENTLRATFKLYGYQTKEFTFTVRVNADAVPGTVLCGKTEVGGLKMKEIRNVVSGYSRETLSAIAAKARQYAESGTVFSDPMEFVSRVYSEVLFTDPFGGKRAREVLDDLFEVQSATKAVLKTNGAFASTVAQNLYGGASLSAAYTENNALVRTVRAHSLTEGDVILCEWNGGVRVYIYLGDGVLATVDSLSLTCSLAENGSEDWKKDGSYYYQKHLLASLFAYRMYAVLRP